MPNPRKKGVILFIVLGVVMVVSLLATVMLRVISNQSRLTHHQVSRIQALYAAKAGMVYALEQLRVGTWTFSPTNMCASPGGCSVPNDASFPASVNQPIKVIFCPAGVNCVGASSACNPPTGINFCINTVVDYTYTP